MQFKFLCELKYLNLRLRKKYIFACIMCDTYKLYIFLICFNLDFNES